MLEQFHSARLSAAVSAAAPAPAAPPVVDLFARPGGPRPLQPNVHQLNWEKSLLEGSPPLQGPTPRHYHWNRRPIKSWRVAAIVYTTPVCGNSPGSFLSSWQIPPALQRLVYLTD